MRRLIAIGGVLLGLALAFLVPSTASAAPNPCAQFLLSERCEPYLGAQYRSALIRSDVHRPTVSNRALGQIAGDICRTNNVRQSLEWVLTTPDIRIADFYLAAHRVC